MPSDEDLLREIEEQEARDDHVFKQELAGKITSKVKRGKVDVEKAIRRHKKDWAPVIERRRRVAAGLPISKNPIFNLFLKVTGQDKIPEVKQFEPSKGMVLVGRTVDDIRREIAEKAKKTK